MIPPQEIVCVECGGTATLISFLPEDGEVEVGDVLAYRCGDCLDRWDIVMQDPLEDGEMDRGS
jgi:hypothetical protein